VNLPSGFDWREKDIFTPVKSQGNCGSCGEFAAIALFEALIKKATGKNTDLSEQEIVSCVQGCGCSTGCSTQRALEYINDLKGVTVYVDGSREGQILNKVTRKEAEQYLKGNNIKESADKETVQCATGSCEI